MPVHIDQMTTTLEFADPERERPWPSANPAGMPVMSDPRSVAAARDATLASLAKAFEGFLVGRGL